MCGGSKKERQKNKAVAKTKPVTPPTPTLPCQRKEPQVQPPPLPRVDPILELDKDVVAVKGAALTMTLRTSRDFEGTGVFTVLSGGDKVKFSHRGQPVADQGNRAELDEGLYAGVVVQIEATDASALEGVEVKWELEGGPAPLGPAVTKKLTAVKATLDIHKRGAGPLSAVEKAGDGRVISLQTADKRLERAKIVIKCEPVEYVGVLVLSAILDNLEVFPTATEGVAETLPYEIPVGPGTAPLELHVQGKTVSAAKVDTGLKLAIKDVADDVDATKMTVMKAVLEIFDYEGVAIADDKKDKDAGVVLFKQNDKFTQPRAKFRVGKEPKDSPCKLVLKTTNAKVSLFPEANEKHVDAETAETLPKDIAATAITDQVKGLVFWAEGKDLNALKETVFQLDADGVDDACDKVGTTVVNLCHDDGTHAPPKLLVVKNGITTTPAERHKIKLKLDHGLGAGTYAWASTSTKFDLTDQTTQVVTLAGKADASSALDAEVLTIVFTPQGKPALPTIKHKVTVFKVKFAECTTQKYGYDDMDDADQAADKAHHVSVKKSDTTKVTVTLTGGVKAKDLEFKSADASIADVTKPGDDLATFDLEITGKAKDNDEVSIEVKSKEHGALLASEIKVNVYKEIVCKVTVYRMKDSTVPASALLLAFDATATETAIHSWYKKAVAKFELTDGGELDVHYDTNGNGKLDLEPGATSAEQTLAATAASAAGQKVVIVRELSWQYQIAADCAIGDREVTMVPACVPSLRFFNNGQSYTFGAGAQAEVVTIESKTGAVMRFAAPITKAHVAGEALFWPLSGLSGNPIWVQETGKDVGMVQRTIGHEVGHSLLKVLDVDNLKCLMHASADRTDTRIRFMEQPRKYSPFGNENQWKTPPRT